MPSQVRRFARRLPRRFLFLLLLSAAVALLPPASHAQATVVTFDPAHTQISMTLDATLHTVHGTFKLKSGKIQFDPQTGKASGSIVIDAASGDTNDAGRDKKMHQDVLESSKFPEISFTAGSVKGAIPASGSAKVTLTGTFRVHGQDHPFTLDGSVDAPSGGQVHVKAKFDIPFKKWGMKDPSNFFLKVGDNVAIEIDATAQLSTVAATP